jgi:hypothetical protein
MGVRREEKGRRGPCGESERREEQGGAHHGGDWDGHRPWRSVLGGCVHGASTSSAACVSRTCRRVSSLHRGEAIPHNSHSVQGQEAVQFADEGFKSPGHAQRFLSAYGPIAQHFRPRRHLLSASEYREELGKRFQSWADITGMEWAA